MRIVRLDKKERGQILRVGLLGLALHALWWRDRGPMPFMQRALTAAVYFAMGVVEVLGGLTGYYIEGPVAWLGAWHVMFSLRLDYLLSGKHAPRRA